MVPEPVYKQIGALIKTRRKNLNITQEKLAGLIGLSRGSLANIETGRQQFLVHQLYALASTLQMEPKDLLPPVAVPPRQTMKDLPLPKDLNSLQKSQVAMVFALKPQQKETTDVPKEHKPR
jgi:transcriptional regulator with XRE-family HTH domain